MRKQPAFFSAHALRDGTIWLALPTCKPRDHRGIDPEGVWQWFVDRVDEDPGLNDIGKVTRNVCITTCVNMRRALRERVEGRLGALEQVILSMKAQLDRIEMKLDELAANRK